MLNRANNLKNELIRLRRDIHTHPELGFHEFRTAALVAETLQEIGGITIKTGVGKTGVVGEMGTGDGPHAQSKSRSSCLYPGRNQQD